MLEAFTPYIIKPTKAAGQNPAYTTPRLKKDKNQDWIYDENEGITYPEEGVERYRGGKVSIEANHYDIPNVTLDRDKLISTSIGFQQLPQVQQPQMQTRIIWYAREPWQRPSILSMVRDFSMKSVISWAEITS